MEKDDGLDFSKLDVIPRLPHYTTPEDGEALPNGLIGATILRMGTAKMPHVEGGGLIIDFVPQGTTRQRRIVLEFNELGMWVRAQTILDGVRE